MVEPGQLLWTPSPERIERARITEFRAGWQRNAGLTFPDFEALWRWSTTDIDAFWQACWDFFGIEATRPATAVLGKRTMPGAEWFPGAELNYARHMLRHERPGRHRGAAPERAPGPAGDFLGRAGAARCASSPRSCASWA